MTQRQVTFAISGYNEDTEVIVITPDGKEWRIESVTPWFLEELDDKDGKWVAAIVLAHGTSAQ